MKSPYRREEITKLKGLVMRRPPWRVSQSKQTDDGTVDEMDMLFHCTQFQSNFKRLCKRFARSKISKMAIFDLANLADGVLRWTQIDSNRLESD